MPKNTDLQAARDVRRAEAIVEDTHSLDCWASARLLRDCADELGISVHAVALAVLSGDQPTAGDHAIPTPRPPDDAARRRRRPPPS